MHHNYYLTPVAVSIALLLSNATHAAESLSLNKTSLPELQQYYQLVLPGHKTAIPVQPNTLNFLKQHTDKQAKTHIRMQQYYEGIQVYGGYAIVHSMNKAQALAKNNSAPVTLNGRVFKGLMDELGKPAPNFVANGSKALVQFKASFSADQIHNEQITPLVYIDESNKAHWAYKVSVYVTYDDRIPERPTAIIDAQTFKPFVQWNDIKTERQMVNGLGFGGNEKSGKITYGKDLPKLSIMRDTFLKTCMLENQEVKVVDVKHGYLCGMLSMRSPCIKSSATNDYWTGRKGDGYDLINGAYSPTNDALYAGYVIKHMYEDWYNIQVLTTENGEPMQLKMCVHYGTGYENAFWDGEQMTFGDGGSSFYPMVSLGISAHEISHGFTEQHSALEYYGQSGGLNESFSDMADQAAKYYSAKVSDWTIGSEIVKKASGLKALRYMDQPSKDGESIDTADDYYSSIDVHHSSGVYNRLFYLIATSPDWNPRKAFDVMVKANADYWTPTANFNEAACGVLNAAKDLGYNSEQIKKQLTLVTVSYADCTKS